MSVKEQIQTKAKAYFDDIVSMRRHLHSNPELSYVEFNTSDFIAQKLKEYDVPFEQGMVKTGVVALIKGNNPDKKTICLRADIDALPIVEANDVPYKSTKEGVMHACGHDAHTSSMLGAARILNEIKNEFEGTIKIIFQPGEEKLPGGASLMIKEGVLENPKVEKMFGQHVYPQMEAGKVGFKKGMYMASADELYLKVTGKGGHAALADAYNNPLLIASQILLNLDKEFMKGEEKPAPTVLAFGKITGEGATNIIPDYVSIAGTFRTMDEEWRAEAHKRMQKIVNDTSAEMGGSAELDIHVGYPFLVNDDVTTENAMQAAKEYLGEENVEELPFRMTSEDFAYYSQTTPVCFYRLGTANSAKGINSGLHTTTFDVEETSLEIGAGLMAWLAINELAT